MRRLVINADDFGMADGVTIGIMEAMQEGVVSSTTAMACVPGSLERITPWLPRVRGRIGVHLQVTDGVPCLPPDEVRSLVGPDGRFPRSSRLVGAIDARELVREWRAQVERLVGVGVAPTHLDTHHSVHRHLPACLRAYIEVARHYGLPVRTGDKVLTGYLRARSIVCTDFCEFGWKGHGGAPALVGLLRSTFAGGGGARTVELMCHPGRVDADLARKSIYVEQREDELRALCSPQVKAALQDLEVEVVSPSSLLEHSGDAPERETP